MHPVLIDQISDEALTIEWSDGHESVYFAKDLRKNCPCAVCEEERVKKTDNPLYVMKTNPQNAVLVEWEMIGRYAISFKFSDNHKTGIYTYEYLRKICQCDICTGNKITIEGPFR